MIVFKRFFAHKKSANPSFTKGGALNTPQRGVAGNERKSRAIFLDCDDAFA